METYQKIRVELDKYAHALSKKAEIIAINKCDCIDDDTLKDIEKEFYKKLKVKPYFISAIAGRGVTDLLRAAAAFVPDKNEVESKEEE